MIKSKIILCVTFIFCLNLLTPAQSLFFDHLTTYNGLSQNSVLCITQDYRGFIWFGTAHGLNRFDGVSFKKYLKNYSSEKNTISNDYINCILADTKKVLWIGTSRGLDKLNLETNTLEKIPVSGSENGISDRDIRSLYEDREGKIWVGTANGLNVLTDRSKNSFAKFYAEEEHGIAGNTIKYIYEDDEYAIWIGTNNGLTRMTGKNDLYQFETFKHEQSNSESLSSDDISAIAQDAAHNIWIGTTNHGLNLFDKNTGTFSRVAMRAVESNTVRTIKKDREGKLWIGTLEGLFIMDPLSGYDTLYQHYSSQPRSLNQNSVYSIFHDVTGSAWIGTYFGGINVAHPYTNFFTIWQNNDSKNSISNDVVSGITEDEKQNLWISTEGGGLNCIDRKTGKISWYLHDSRKVESIGSNKVKTIYKDPEGDIWAGTTGGGLNLLNRETGSFTHFIFDPANPATLGTEIIALLEDSQKRFWVGTRNGLKLFMKSGKSLLPDTSEILAGSISTDYINTIIEDSRNNIWVGTYSGLFLLKKNEKKFGAMKGFATVVNCLYEDRKGNLWVGIFYAGLVKYTPATGTITHYAIEDNVPGNQVLSICGDEQNNLWMATDIGLCRLNLNDSTLRIFNPGDGIVVGGNVKNSFYKSKSGEFFFGGQNGLTSFFPGKIQINKYEAPLVFTSLRLFSNRTDVDEKDKLFTKDISLTDKIRFRHNQNVFTISYALLSYINSAKNTYAYKLEGLDKDWNHSNNNFITYTYLPPGKYTLLVKGANSDGIWSKPTALDIEILPPAWKTWWAYFTYLSLFIIVTVFTIRYFLQRRLQNNETAIS